MDGERRISQVPLRVSDKQVAQEKLRQLVQEREKELHGLIPAKVMRDAAQESLTKHLKEICGQKGEMLNTSPNLKTGWCC